MTATKQALFDYLDELGIAHSTIEHEPIFTVEQGRDIKASMPGGHTKNLFLKDKAGKLFLICALGETQVKINRLHPLLGCKRLSFGKPTLMETHLGVTPGSVTLFAILNDSEKAVTLVIDQALLGHEIVNFHPLLNDATTAISSADMIRFAKAANHDPIILDFHSLS